jgi:ACS family hexuronate transporter-like MFS transporter
MAIKWRLCIFLFLATTLNYLSRQTLSILAPVMQKEMHLDNQALGSIFSAFYYAYTFAQFAVGIILDRVSLRWALGAAVLGWSLVTASTGLATGFFTLWLARLALGIMESANWPASTRIVARALEPRERALGNGIFTSGTSVAALVAPTLILRISSAFGWRWTFGTIGLLGVVWPGVWYWFTRRRQWENVWRDKSTVQCPRTHSAVASLLTVLKSRRFFPVLVVALVVNPCLYFSVNWLPTYFVQQRGLPPGRQMGWILTAIYLGLDLGNLACGTGVLALTRRGYSMQSAWRIVIFVAAATACCGAVPLLANMRQAVAALIAVNFGLGLWTAMMLTMVQEVAPERVSTSQGIFGASGALAGAWAMTAVGAVTQATTSFTIPFVMVAVCAIMALAAGWIASRNVGLNVDAAS